MGYLPYQLVIAGLEKPSVQYGPVGYVPGIETCCVNPGAWDLKRFCVNINRSSLQRQHILLCWFKNREHQRYQHSNLACVCRYVITIKDLPGYWIDNRLTSHFKKIEAGKSTHLISQDLLCNDLEQWNQNLDMNMSYVEDKVRSIPSHESWLVANTFFWWEFLSVPTLS